MANHRQNSKRNSRSRSASNQHSKRSTLGRAERNELRSAKSKSSSENIESDQAPPIPKAIRVSRTKVGKGVFARRHFTIDAIVGEIEGELIEDDDYGSDYCMCFGDGRVLEPAAPFRFVNHSCSPNCEFVWYDVNEGKSGAPKDRRMFLIATRDIHPDEELTIDYAWPAEGAIRCRCGADNCRGWVVDARQLDEIAQLKP